MKKYSLLCSLMIHFLEKKKTKQNKKTNKQDTSFPDSARYSSTVLSSAAVLKLSDSGSSTPEPCLTSNHIRKKFAYITMATPSLNPFPSLCTLLKRKSIKDDLIMFASVCLDTMDFSSMTLTQIKRQEMDAQVRTEFVKQVELEPCLF